MQIIYIFPLLQYIAIKLYEDEANKALYFLIYIYKFICKYVLLR